MSSNSKLPITTSSQSRNTSHSCSTVAHQQETSTSSNQTLPQGSRAQWVSRIRASLLRGQRPSAKKSHMTVETEQAISRPRVSASQTRTSAMMEQYSFWSDAQSPRSQLTPGDHALSPDFGMMDLGNMYAPSPNSMCFYESEQRSEHQGMCGLGMSNAGSAFANTIPGAGISLGSSCGATPSLQSRFVESPLSSNSGLMNMEDFDLNPRYENSDDLKLHQFPDSFVESCSGEGNTIGNRSSMLYLGSLSESSTLDSDTMAHVFQACKKDAIKSGPTLTQLNCETVLPRDICSTSQRDHCMNNLSNEELTDIQTIDYKPSHLIMPTPYSASVSAWKTLPVSVASKSQTLSTPIKLSKNSDSIKKEYTELTTCSISKNRQSLSPTSLAQSFLHPIKQELEVEKQNCCASIATMPSVQKPHSTEGTGSEENSMDAKWEEIKTFIHESRNRQRYGIKREVDAARRERLDSGSSVFTSHDPDSDISDPGDEDNDTDSDSDSSQHSWSVSVSSSRSGSKRKQQQFFWQYNVQSKGPKGKRLCRSLDSSDPYHLPHFEDPVFDRDNSLPGISHGGKARRGDGNDIIPNPRKLYQLGIELQQLNERINNFAPLTDLPAHARSKSKKDKNKLASRACRLKKKAQHEANKVKLHGLQLEHNQLMKVITTIQRELLARVNEGVNPAVKHEEKLTVKLQSLIDLHINDTYVIANNTANYVNIVVEKVEAGDLSGGLIH